MGCTHIFYCEICGHIGQFGPCVVSSSHIRSLYMSRIMTYVIYRSRGVIRSRFNNINVSEIKGGIHVFDT